METNKEPKKKKQHSNIKQKERERDSMISKSNPKEWKKNWKKLVTTTASIINALNNNDNHNHNRLNELQFGRTAKKK